VVVEVRLPLLPQQQKREQLNRRNKMKPFLKGIVRNEGKGRQGLGIQLFRLDAAEEAEINLTDFESEEADGSETATTAIMRIYEDIGENFWTGEGITAKKFASELDELGDIKRLNIHINCLGGDAFTAQAIHSIIGAHSAKTTSYIDGVAASAATLIACAADEVIARYNTSYMVHYPWAMSIGNAEVMRKAAEDLDQLTIPIVNVYKEQVKGKIDEDKIRELMANETWMSADEALKHGFVDKVRGKIRAIAKVNNTQIFCSGQTMNFAKYQYQNMPKYPLDATLKPKAKIARISVNKPEEKENKPMPMTIEELREQHPELLSSVQNKAAQDERIRLAALDALIVPGTEAIIAKAKADGKQPIEVMPECYAIAQANIAQAGAMQKLNNDAKAAGNVPAGDAPSVKPKGDDKKNRGIELLTKAQTNLHSRRLPQLANGNSK
jgi:ATP-dependent protease ClpP protease subunit